MNQKVGRNDPCPCGSGKKYKQCCIKNEKPRGLKKFSAKVISAGGAHKPKPEPQESAEFNKAVTDYNTLMERSFGTAIHSEEAPPLPDNPSEYMKEEK